MNSIELAARERFRRDANSARKNQYEECETAAAAPRSIRAAVAVAQQHKAAVSAHRLQARSSRS